MHPSSRHTNTAADIAATSLPTGTIALWWLGQASFVLRSSHNTFFLDPFFSRIAERLVPPSFSAQESPLVDYVLYTHEHLDHLDLPTCATIAQRSPNARFVVPPPIIGQLTAKGIEATRVIGVQPGEEITLGTAQLFPIPALHGLSSPPARYDFGFEDSQGLYRYLGYVRSN